MTGFSLFGTEHLLALVFIFATVVFLVLLYSRLRTKNRKIMLFVICFLLPILEIWKICRLCMLGQYGIGYLPLHFCSLAVYLYPVCCLLSPGKFRDTLTGFCFSALFPAALSALLFPDWTDMPILSFLSLHSFIWHMLQILMPLCLFSAKEYRAKVWHSITNLLLLFSFGIPIFIFDRITGCNYWFLLRPVPGTPLETLFHILGKTGYLPALAAFASMIILLMSLFWAGCCKKRSAFPR